MNVFLKKIDMFGTPAKLNTFGETSYKTSFGGILTLLTFVTIGFFSYIFGTDFYHRENPRVVESKKFHKKSKPYILDSKKNPFMFKFGDAMSKNIGI